jgi:16S rRNA (uracil1498-N3)-methyltransferase
MNRFYIDKKGIDLKYNSIRLTDPLDVRHLAGALRLSVGEGLCVCDGDGGAYETRVDQIARGCIVLKIVKKFKKQDRKDRTLNITLACAVPKYAHFDEVVDKGTQLGVCEIIPLITERTLLKQDAVDKKHERFKRVMVAAAKQSGVLFLPELRSARSFNELIKGTSGYDLCLLPNLSVKSLSLKEAIKPLFKKQAGRRVLLMIGPEGDFTKSEIDHALEAGCQGIDLGESVLRVDTAAIAAVSFLRLSFGL